MLQKFKLSILHNFRNLISKRVFSYLGLRFSNFLTTEYMSLLTTVYMHKVSSYNTGDQLPAIFNMETATYDFGKYLAQLIKQLIKSQLTIKDNKSFTNKAQDNRDFF